MFGDSGDAAGRSPFIFVFGEPIMDEVSGFPPGRSRQFPCLQIFQTNNYILLHDS